MRSEHKKLLTIKEFSELTGIRESTLRYWDRIGLFQSAMRHEDNNYRFYTLEQVVSVNFVSVLSRLKLPLKTIADISGPARSPGAVISLLEQQEFEIDREVLRLHEIHSTIHILKDMYRQGLEAVPGEIGVRHFEPMPIIMGPENAYGEGDLFYRALTDYCREAKHNRVNTSNPIGGWHTDMESYLAVPGQPQHFFSVDPTGCDCRPGGDYLTGYVQGYYGQMGDMPRKLAGYARENNLECEGPVYVVYLLDDVCVPEPAQYLGQVSVRVRRRKTP